jgi:hypothetical protein
MQAVALVAYQLGSNYRAQDKSRSRVIRWDFAATGFP